jgi:hypothetical protein
VQEIGGKISYDLLGLWSDEPRAARDFSLKASFQAFYELQDENGDEETYMALGLEPAYRFELFGRRAGVSLPLLWGFSPDGYTPTPTATTPRAATSPHRCAGRSTCPSPIGTASGTSTRPSRT